MTDETTTDRTTPSFAIFRGAAVIPNEATPIMRQEPLTPVMLEGAGRLMAAGIEHGSETRLLFEGGGFSLLYAWFKSDYPLPRHSHDTDCLYYVLAGSLHMGSETLGAGDGFFVGGGTPYTYRPGPEGVEVLEFRAGGSFNIKLFANNPGFWATALQTVTGRHDDWKQQVRPSELRSPESVSD